MAGENFHLWAESHFYLGLNQQCIVCHEPVVPIYIFCSDHLTEWENYSKKAGGSAYKWALHKRIAFLIKRIPV